MVDIEHHCGISELAAVFKCFDTQHTALSWLLPLFTQPCCPSLRRSHRPRSHTTAGLIPSATQFKTTLCQKWLTTGRCAYGVRCTFLHARDAAALVADSNLPFMRRLAPAFAADAVSRGAGGPGSGDDGVAGAAAPELRVGWSRAPAAPSSVASAAEAALVEGRGERGGASGTAHAAEARAMPAAATSALAAPVLGASALAGPGGQRPALHHVVAAVLARAAGAGLAIPPMALRHALTGVRSAEDWAPDSPDER
jgi:hypothetical protein